MTKPPKAALAKRFKAALTRKRIIVVVVVLFCFLAPVVYLLGGMSNRKAKVAYGVSIEKPGTGLAQVSMVIYPPRRPYLTLYLRDTVLGGHCRVRSVSAKRGGRKVLHWQAIPGFADLRNVWTGFSRKPVEITYEVDPRWTKNPRAYKCYLGPDFGYLRGMTTLYAPITLREAMLARKQISTYGDGSGYATLQFSLPAEWRLISPWPDGDEKVTVSKLRNVYFGVGPMSVKTLQAGETRLLLGVYLGLNEDERAALLRDIPTLFETMVRSVDVPLKSHAQYWTLMILPHEPIGGGSSGTNSLAVHNKLSTISHEMFHWWNGTTIQTTPDANWIKEGFTKYYEGKILHTAGIWSSERFADHLEYCRTKLWQDRKPMPINLCRSSERLLRETSAREYDNVYFGGALVAHSLDRALQEQGKSLDAIWKLLDDRNSPVATKVFLEVLATLGGEQLARECEEVVYGRRTIGFADRLQR